MTALNAVLIGLGMVADTHARALADAKGARLHGIYARRPEQAEAFTARHGGARIYDDITAIAADPQVDFVIILTPPDARLEIVQSLTTAGKPLLLEKPIERDTIRADEIVTLCEAAGLPCGVTLQHRMRAAAQALKAQLDAGDLGQIGTVDVRIPWWRDQSYYDAPGRGTYARDGGGVLITQAIHTLDLMLHLCGPVAAVQALTANSTLHDLEAEDFATAGLLFRNSAAGSVMATTTQFPGAAEEIVINAERASARLVGDRLTLHWRDGQVEEIAGASETGGGADPMAFSHGWHQAVIEDFAAALRDNRPPAITGRSALAVHRLIDAIAASSRSGQRVELKGDTA